MLQERFISLLPVEKVENLNLFLPDMHFYEKSLNPPLELGKIKNDLLLTPPPF